VSGNGGLTLDRLRLDVAAILGVAPQSVAVDVSLLEQGLDSIRLMTLVERWRAQGASLTFADLAGCPTLSEWAELVATLDGGHV
jgi:aryl carrier-like protein